MFKLIVLLMIILLCYKSRKSLHMLQQNLYNENNRYVKWNIRNLSQYFNLEIITIIGCFIGLFIFYDLRLYN